MLTISNTNEYEVKEGEYRPGYENYCRDTSFDNTANMGSVTYMDQNVSKYKILVTRN